MTEIDKLTKWGPVVARCRSARDPEKTYEVRRHPSGTYSCNCKSWATSASDAKSCKHTTAAELTEGRSGIVQLGGRNQTMILQRSDPKRVDFLRGALDKMRVDVAAAVEREVERTLKQAGRPVVVLPAPKVVVPLGQGLARPKRSKADPIKITAMECASTLSSWGPLPVKIERVAGLIEDAIRKCAGSAPVAVAVPVKAERGVREIILSDEE